MVRRYIRENATENSRGNPVGVVVAEALDQDRVAIGFSICHHNDRYNKELGNTIANSRLNSGAWVVQKGTNLKQLVNSRSNNVIDTINWAVDRARTRYLKTQIGDENV